MAKTTISNVLLAMNLKQPLTFAVSEDSMNGISPLVYSGDRSPTVSPLIKSEPSHSSLASGNDKAAEEAMRASAHDFEAAFLTQMLTFSGLGDALTLGGGEASSAFAGFYIESLAEKMTEAGGLGLADRFYVELQQLSNLKNGETLNDDLGKL